MELSRTATMETTELQCIEQARLAAIAREFGTTVTETTINNTRDINGQTENSFQLLTRSSVLGEWIEDKKEPIVSWHCEGDRLNVTATLNGLIRMLPKESKVEVSFYPCSPGDPTRSKSDFFQGETLNAIFKSSSNGHLSIYYVDHGIHTVQRLLPSATMESANHIAVQADRKYLLFNRKTAADYGWGQASIEIALELRSGSKAALDELIAVFSTEEYTKPSLQTEDALAELSEESFKVWLTDLKARQRQAVVQRISISIQSK